MRPLTIGLSVDPNVFQFTTAITEMNFQKIRQRYFSQYLTFTFLLFQYPEVISQRRSQQHTMG